MFDYLYNSEIVDVVAYGVDEFDYTPNLIGFGTSIGETGYMEMRFSRGTLFFSTDGITETMPVRKNVHQIPTDSMRADVIGRRLKCVEEGNGESRISLYDCKPIVCYLEKNDGHCDRDYFSIDVLDPDGVL